MEVIIDLTEGEVNGIKKFLKHAHNIKKPTDIDVHGYIKNEIEHMLKSPTRGISSFVTPTSVLDNNPNDIEFDGGYILKDTNALRVTKGEKILAYTNFDIKSKQNYGDYMFVKLFDSVSGVVDLNNIGIFCKTLKEDKIVGKILLDYVKSKTKEKGCHTIICQTSRQLPIRDRTKKILIDNGFRIYQTHWSCDMFVFRENYSYTQLETIKEQESGKKNWYFMHNYEEAMSWEKNSPEDYEI